MATITATKESTMTFQLVAYNWGRTAGFDRLLDRLGEIAEIRNVSECETTNASGEVIDGLRIEIAGVRDTIAHGLACRLGFVAHCE